MFSGNIPLLVVGSIAAMSLLLGLRQLLVNRRLGLELRQLQQLLTAKTIEFKPVSQPETEEKNKPNFSASLNQIEQEQKKVAVPGSSAEKYRYVASLANQGVDAKEIAAALQMSPAEVAQLLQLARLKQ